MNTADAIAEILMREGVEFLIGYPVNPVIEAAAKAGIRTIIVRQERTGLHMADAVGRISSGQRIGVFAMQHGPGCENAFGGVAQAYADSVPLVVLAGGYARHLTNIPPNFNSSLNYRHVTKWTEQVTRAVDVPAAMRRAFTQAKNGRPRPVLVEIPKDVFDEAVQEPLPYTATFSTRSAPDPGAVKEAASMLLQAKRPVIYAGQGIHYARAWPQLKDFAELLEVPVMTSLQGKSAFPENHPLALGAGGRSLPRTVHHFLHEADVIFGIGCSFARTSFGVFIPPGKTIIHATLDSADLNKDLYAAHALIGDAKLILEGLIQALKDLLSGKERGRSAQLADEIRQMKKDWIDAWMPKLAAEETPLSPYRILWDLMHTVDRRNTVITHDAGSPRDQLSPFWESVEPLTYIGWGKSTQLGYGLGLAMGAKLARPDRLCINVMGDAAIGMTGMDFETAAREHIPILTILFNNFSMAIEIPVMKAATEKYRSTDISGNYAEFAKALGGYGERITQPEDIVPAIKRGIQKVGEGVPTLLEFITAKEIEYAIPSP